MNRSAAMVPLLFGLVCSACASRRPAEVPAGPVAPATAEADIRDSAGRTVARSTVTQVGDTLRVRIEAAGLAPGIYATHFHTVGRCDSSGFESAGPHWNPRGRQHGRDNPRGQHLGDLPNLLVGTDGVGSFEFTIPGAFLAERDSALLDRDGATLVVHARADDHRTEPSGNSGARIGCGVLR